MTEERNSDVLSPVVHASTSTAKAMVVDEGRALSLKRPLVTEVSGGGRKAAMPRAYTLKKLTVQRPTVV